MPNLLILAIITIIIVWLLLKPFYSIIGKKTKNTYKELKYNLTEEDDDE